MMWGLDYLGGAKYKDVILKEHPAGWAAGIFATEFGDAYPTCDALLATGRCPLLRVQLIWGGSSHSYGDKDISKIKTLAAKYNKLAVKYPNTTIELSPQCEHNLRNPDKYLDIVQQSAPNCRPVNSPWKGAVSTKYKNERHQSQGGPIKGNYNFSFDGIPCVDADVSNIKSEHSDASVFFFWDARFNLHKESNEPARDTPPDSALIDSIIYLKNLKGGCSLPNKWIYKSHGEYNTDWRSEKPCMISPIKAKQIVLRAANGQIVSTLKYYGTFTGGGYRYYSADWGYQSAEKGKRIQGGDPVCDVVIDGKKYGRVNPAFRQNAYRNK